MSIINVLWGLFGIMVVCGIAFLFSNNKKKINYRLVLIGIGFQITFAWVVLATRLGKRVLEAISDFVNTIIGYANEGIDFVFGGLYTEESGISFVVAFNVLPMIIFFASLIALLYYLRIMPFVFKYIGGFFAKLLSTTKRESVVAAANIFVGQTESPFVVKPYLSKMSNSEIFTVMTCGLASIAGTMLAAYAALGIRLDYLLTASFMAAPSGLIMAKIFYPETETINEDADLKVSGDEESSNVIDALSRGAKNGLDVALIVGATLIAFVAAIAIVNGFLGYVGGWFGVELSLQTIFGYIFSPLAFAIGIPWADAVYAGAFFGEKLVLTEFIAFTDFASKLEQLSAKSEMIITFALCGFANFTSMATLTNTLGRLVPERNALFMQLSFRSVFAGMLASMLSAACAGMFFS